MNAIKLIVSDLHVAGGDSMLDTFGERQQAALEGLLSVASKNGGSPLGEADDVELIINGDCFDFLGVKPYDTGGVMDTGLAVEKLGRMIEAHGPFFDTLGRFVKEPGRHITFLTGNHDLELCFAEVRASIVEAMGSRQDDQRVCFCPTRGYRPLPDVYIEHGNAYDFWTCDSRGFWNAPDNVSAANPPGITLSHGSRYMQHVGYPILEHYPYLSLFEPQMSILRQTALFCLLNPAVVVEMIQHLLELLDADGRGRLEQKLIYLAGGEGHGPVALFEQVVMALLAFQQDVETRLSDWKEPSGEEAALQAQVQAMMDVAMVREILSRTSEDTSESKTIAKLCTPMTDTVDESLAAGMQIILKSDPSLHYAFAGHTHRTRMNTIEGGTAEQQVYLNTGSWISRLTLPAPEEMTPELVAWLRKPDSAHIPLHDVPPNCVFALVTASNEGPSSASLCVWEDGRRGQYRVLAQ